MTEKIRCNISEKDIFPLMNEELGKGRQVRFTVSGNSMWPLLVNNRDSVLIEACDSRFLKKGEIILFRTSGNSHVLHRITKVLRGGYITTGDGNLNRDGFVPAEYVMARVSRIYRKERVIICDALYWKIIFNIWMAAYPIRKYLQKVIIWIKRY